MKKTLRSGLAMRLVSFVAGTAMAVGLITPSLASYAAEPLFADGSGTKADPYRITSQQELSNIRKTDGLFFRLENDLTLYRWEPIGTAADPLVGGGFDGNGYTIRSMKTSGTDYAGVFGYTQRLSVINLGVDTASVQADKAGGGIVGRASGGSIKNCYVTGSVGAKEYAGGIVGVADDTVIQGCFTNTSLAGEGYKGGITGGGGNVSGSYFSTDLVGQSVGQLSSAQKKNNFDSSAGGLTTAAMQSDNFPARLSSSKLASASEWERLEEGSFPTQVTNRTRVLSSYEASPSGRATSAPVEFEPVNFTSISAPFDETAFVNGKIIGSTNNGDAITSTNYIQGSAKYTLTAPTQGKLIVQVGDDNLARDANNSLVTDKLGNYIYVVPSNTDPSTINDFPYWDKTYMIVCHTADSNVKWSASYEYTVTPPDGTATKKPGTVIADESLPDTHKIIPTTGIYYNPQASKTFVIDNQATSKTVFDSQGKYDDFFTIDVFSDNNSINLTDTTGMNKFKLYKYISGQGFSDPADKIIIIDHISKISEGIKGSDGNIKQNAYRISLNIPNSKDNVLFKEPGDHSFALKHYNNKNMQEGLGTDPDNVFKFTITTKRDGDKGLTVVPSLNSLDLSWQPAENVTSYNVYIQEGDKTLEMDDRIKLENLSASMHSNVRSTSITLKSLKSGDAASLKPNTGYTVAVLAKNAEDATVFYGPKFVTTKATPSVTKSNVNPTSVNLSWTAQDSGTGWSYTLYMSTTDITKPDAKFDGATPVTLTGTQYGWTKLEPGKKYYFNVVASNPSSPDVVYQGVEVTTPAQGQLAAPTITTNAADPKALPAGGKVTITMKQDNTQPCEIYYTLNGSAPNINSTKYSGPFEITSKNLNGETISISAICLQDSLVPSAITKLDLTFGKSSLLPLDGKVLDIYDYSWSEIVAALESSTTGTVEIMLDENTTTIPKSFFAAIAGKDMTITLNMLDYSWTLKGKDVKTARESIDMGLVYGNDISLVSGRYLAKLDEVDYIDLYQMSLNHEGAFPFNAKLTLNLGRGNSGTFGNLYYVNENRKRLDYMESSNIGKTGEASYEFSHASSYLIVVSEEQMSNIGSGAFIEDIIVPIQKLPPVIPICAGALLVGVIMMIVVRKITKD